MKTSDSVYNFEHFSDLRSSLDATHHADANNGKVAEVANTSEDIDAATICQDHENSADDGASDAAITVDQEAAEPNAPIEARKPATLKKYVKAA